MRDFPGGITLKGFPCSPRLRLFSFLSCYGNKINSLTVVDSFGDPLTNLGQKATLTSIIS